MSLQLVTKSDEEQQLTNENNKWLIETQTITSHVSTLKKEIEVMKVGSKETDDSTHKLLNKTKLELMLEQVQQVKTHHDTLKLEASNLSVSGEGFITTEITTLKTKILSMQSKLEQELDKAREVSTDYEYKVKNNTS